MQAEILAANAASRVRLLAVNEAGLDSGNAFLTGAIPLLQESAVTRGPWRTWNPVYRDVVVTDGQNRAVAVFNLTEHDLRVQAEYDALKAILLAAAGED